MADKREINAYHESAHCIVSHVLGCHPQMITIDGEPRVEHADSSNARAVALVLYAGPVAAERAGGPASLPGSLDLVMLGQFVSRLPSDVAEAIPSMARDLVDRHWSEIKELAHIIRMRGTLQGDALADELARIFRMNS